MRIASPSRLIMTARTDKEARLKDFIAEALARRCEGTPSETVMLVARNPDSPIARALCAALTEGSIDLIGVRVIFGDTHVDEPGSVSLLDIGGAAYRVLRDPRFGAAHEQLVVGTTYVWIGDCLRRDPAKRDAFELYYKADIAIRLFAAASFEKLWASAKPLKPVTATVVAPEIIAAGQSDDPDAMPRRLSN